MNETRTESRQRRQRWPRAIGICAAVAVVAATGWLAGIEPSPNAAVSVEPIAKPKPAVSPSREASAANYIGVSGCTAAACHGGPLSGPSLPAWQTAYTVWASPEPRVASGAAATIPGESPAGAARLVDKHNRAYAALFDERSKRIVQLLDRLPDTKSAAPQRDARCTICHSVPVDPKAAAASLLADGIGCELCHGPAKNWLREHTHLSWLKDYRAGAFKQLTDMRNTRDLVERAQICASCHVGDGQLGRDVNHDLIAAGHPRLNFQFHAYLGVMPKHWSDKPGAKPGVRTDRETNAEAWAIGQLVSAEAALRLLASRAASAEKQSAPWPEFAEYGCYACHHQLSDKRATQREKTLEASERKLAAISLPWTWGTWYFPDAELRVLLGSELFAKAPEAKQALELIDQVRAEMAKASPSPSEVDSTSRQAADRLAALANRIEAEKFDSRTIDDLLTRAADEHFSPADWDEAAQRLLTIDALWNAYQFSRPQTNANDSAAVSAALDGLRKVLEFPRPAREAFGGAKQVSARVDSPANYDADAVTAQFKMLFGSLKRLLGSDRP